MSVTDQLGERHLAHTEIVTHWRRIERALPLQEVEQFAAHVVASSSSRSL